MIYCFHICACLCLVIFKTTVLPYIPLFNTFYDLLALYVIFMGTFLGIREGIPVSIFMGLLMDSLSGCPFGLYLTTYFWLYIGVSQFKKIFHITNYIILSLVVAAVVLTENMILFGTSAMLEPGIQFSSNIVKSFTYQVLWAVFTGPLIIKLYNFAYNGSKRFFSEVADVLSRQRSSEIDR